MKHLITSLFFVLLFSNYSTAQITHAEYEWQVLSWIRKARLDLLVSIETHEFKKQTYEYYNSTCQCTIDGIELRKSIDTLINQSNYTFVKHIYTEMRDVVPNKDVLYYDLAPLWNNKLKELEAVFLNTKSKQEDELGYVSKQELRSFSLGRIGTRFRIEVLKLYPYNENAPTSLESLGSRWFKLVAQHLIPDSNQEKYACCEIQPLAGAYDECKQQKATSHIIKTKKQFRSYMFCWMSHMNSAVKNYTNIIDDSRKKTLNEIIIHIPSLKENILNHSKKSTFPFVRMIYQRFHDVLPKQDTMGKVDVLELFVKTITEIQSDLFPYPDTKKATNIISCKELNKIKDIRHLYDILDVESNDKAKEDHEIQSVWIYLIEKSIL